MMNKWMKVISGMIVATVLVTVLAGVTLAQGPGDGRGSAWGFVDEDGDGINDRYLSDPQFVNEDDDGVCDLCGGVPGETDWQDAGRGFGQGFVDEDGDGINDRYFSDPQFVDEDGDGECDNYLNDAQATGRGRGRGRWSTDG